MKKRNFILFFLVMVFVSSARPALAATEVSADINAPDAQVTTWRKENSPYIVLKYIYVNSPLVIEPGVVVKFKNLSVAGLGINSAFTAVGSPSDPIIFTSTCDYAYGGETKSYCSYKAPLSGDWYSLRIYPQYKQPATIEYAKILYANEGIYYATNDCYGTYKNYLSVKHSEIKYSFFSGIFLRYTQPIMDSLTLSNNRYGIEVYASNYNQTPKIRNSAIVNNADGIRGNGPAYIDARYNWWGNSSGPYYGNSGSEASNESGKGNRIVGTAVLFRPWDQSDPTVPKKSVIFIPGVGASLNPDLMFGQAFSDNWTMMDHTYDGILTAFKGMGYVENENFFIAYYDWRQGNAESAEKYLKPIIAKALSRSDANQVNIVTHSMGSLVARSYVQNDGYANDVDNLIMIAPPNRGSSDVYAAWEGGRIPDNWDNRSTMKAYLSYLTATTSKTSSYYDTIHKYIPSLKELMPVYDYLHLAGEAQNLKSYALMQEQNNFLQNLNSGLDKLNARTRFSIILGNSQPTVNKIPVVNSDKEGLWSDGKPDPIDPQFDDAGGDGEVLISSGDTLSAFRDVLEYNHRDIVSKSEKIVAERLDENLDFIYDSPDIDNEIAFWTDAPAKMEIIDPIGDTVVTDNDGTSSARYAEEKNKDGFKILSVPNPQKGNYEVKLDGNADGQFHVGVEYASLDGKNSDQSKSVAVEIKKDETQSFVVANDPENSTTPIADITPKDIIAPTINISAPQDGKEYFNNEKIILDYVVTDNVSMEENMQIELWLDNEEITGETSIDLAQKELGAHYFEVYATDEAGNSAYAWVEFTTVLAPPPEDAPIVSVADEAAIIPPASEQAPVVENESNSELVSKDAPAVIVAAVPLVENVIKKDEHWRKPHEKAKESVRKKVVKTSALNGVTKYSGKIKIESSTVNLPPEPKSVQDVFGFTPERNLDSFEYLTDINQAQKNIFLDQLQQLSATESSQFNSSKKTNKNNLQAWLKSGANIVVINSANASNGKSNSQSEGSPIDYLLLSSVALMEIFLHGWHATRGWSIFEFKKKQ